MLWVCAWPCKKVCDQKIILLWLYPQTHYNIVCHLTHTSPPYPYCRIPLHSKLRANINVLLGSSALKDTNSEDIRPRLQLSGKFLQLRCKALAVSAPAGVQLNHPCPLAVGDCLKHLVTMETVDTRSWRVIEGTCLVARHRDKGGRESEQEESNIHYYTWLPSP